MPVYRVQWQEMYKEQVFVKCNGFGALKYLFKDPDAKRLITPPLTAKKRTGFQKEQSPFSPILSTLLIISESMWIRFVKPPKA